MKRCTASLLLLLFLSTANAQEYKVTTDKTDPFSQSLVQLLNAAATTFNTLKGDSLRSTSLMGDDYKLNIDITGSHFAVVRIRDWDHNVYVEFRGYADVKAVGKGVRDLVAKMQHALGAQLETPRFVGNMTSLCIKDSKGFFASNIDVFAGSSSSDPYLLGPEKEKEDGTPKKYFILLKIHAGVPNYQSYIPANIIAPDPSLDKTVKQLVKDAVTDFKSLPPLVQSTSTKKRKTDSLSMNGYPVYVSKRGQNYSVAIPVFPAKLSLDDCHTALQAALGNRYVVQTSELMERKYNIYYVPNNNAMWPTIYLEYPRDPVLIRIESRHGHATKRNADLYD
jgi:hypothetical protein